MIKRLLLLCSILVVPQALAEPSPPIAKVIQKPATAFDIFLFRLYEAGKCNNVVKNNNADEADLCLSSISYDADKNVLSTFFRVFPSAEVMDDFADQEYGGRKEIMLKVLENTVRRVGAVDTWGLLHSTPMSYGGSFSEAEEKSFRAELAQRTSTALSTSYDGVVYIATRHQDGTIEYFTSQ
jgi:hypothetical protein